MTTWRPALGAIVQRDGRTSFSVWAPAAESVDVVIERHQSLDQRALARQPDGVFTRMVDEVGAGCRYRYRLNGDDVLLPDPASRFQPDGVHGASMTVDPGAFRWTDERWTGIPLSDLVIYELHVGTFTPEGTFSAAIDHLADLAALGVSAIELMPVADFPGRRNWGYDGAALFAPARCYGTPDHLRRLVDAAHHAGLAVILDVVYNHVGPDGAYLPAFSPYFFTTRHHSPWGAGINFDGEHSRHVRALFVENALHWIHEYHVDGLRLDATHAIRDDGPRHFIAELTASVRAFAPPRHVHVIAEDDRNLAPLVIPQEDGGFGVDAVWADDFHHQMRRRLAGDRDGYYSDYSGSTADIAATIRHGWFYRGQHSAYKQAPRGSDPSAVPPARFVVCLQNHDQVGNRAFGERLHHQIDAAAYRAASALLLVLPQTPLLFMGQEWAASSPFLYFTDHTVELGRRVTEGRRSEFARFAAFADAGARARIPDPQALATFEASRLDWAERDREPHAGIARLYAALLAFRREWLSRSDPQDAGTARGLDDETLLLNRRGHDGSALAVVTRFRPGAVRLPIATAETACRVLLTSDDPPFTATAAPPILVDARGDHALLQFHGPGTVILRVTGDMEVSAA